MRGSKKLLLLGSLLILSLILGACSPPGSSSTEPTLEQEMGGTGASMTGMATDSDVPADLDTSTTRMTDQGAFQVSVSSNLDPVDINQIHSWTLHVETPEGQSVEKATIAVDGGMPQHNHGFPTSPQVTEELGDGDYLVEGVKFNMGGWWEMSFDITANGQSDHVTFNIILQQ